MSDWDWIRIVTAAVWLVASVLAFWFNREAHRALDDSIAAEKRMCARLDAEAEARRAFAAKWMPLLTRGGLN